MHRGVIKFCVVGALVFAIDFAAIALLKRILPPLAAVSIAYVIAVSAHFSLNKWWVFGATTPFHTQEALRYVAAVAACWLCTVAVVAVALRYFTGNLYLAKALAVPPTTLLGFALLRSFVFR